MASKKPERRFEMTQLKIMQTALQKMKDGHFVVQVGIFGNKSVRKEDYGEGLTNAEIGLIHEMGSSARKIPRRSFLWDTFVNHSKELLPLLAKDVEQLLKKGNIDAYLQRMGIEATNLVIKAFETSGFGAWAPNAYSTLLRKLRGSLARRRQMAAEVLYEGAGHAKPLIDKGELWQSISSRTAKA